MRNEWFWNNRLMTWLERRVLSFTNWFWKKRHPPVSREIPPPKKQRQKKNNWNVKP